MTDLETLAARVQTLEDTIAIQDIMAKYGRMLDTGAWSDYRTLFAEDLHAEHDVVTAPIDGLDTFLAAAEALSGLMEDAQHYVTNVEVEVDGDEASARAFVFAMHDVVLDGERQLVPAGGRYENRLRRTPEGWKIYDLMVHETWLDERVGKIYADAG